MLLETLNRIAIIGGTGRAGRYLAQKALESGYHVRMLARNPDKAFIKDDRLQVIAGDARNIQDLRSLLEGCHAVINTFGQPAKDTPLYSSVTHTVLTVMQEYGITRYIGVAGGSLNVQGDRKSFLNRIASTLFYILFGKMIADRKKELDLLMKSDIQWTLVRLPFVVEGLETGHIKENLRDIPGRNITNSDIAKFLVSQVNEMKYVKRTPCISN
ncbi:NAD(P)-dependent oxidoreductase [Paenibacillus sp. URB8-2]|uniref:NAD(P)-dependent oxidoreductase n=1 Tax=Paenibacillus sp. URB8-2 TaxID=2741301 RepID=UPI002F96C61F